jgi:hypothetical protein
MNLTASAQITATHSSVSVMTGEKCEQLLYAVAVEIFRKGRLVSAKIKYLHALDQQNAKLKFRHAYPNANKYRIVAIAPVIGLFVNDKQGRDLSIN